MSPENFIHAAQVTSVVVEQEGRLPMSLIHAAQVTASVAGILFLPLSVVSLWLSWRRSRRSFPKTALLLPCMAILLSFALGLYAMAQFAQGFGNLPFVIDADPALLATNQANALYPLVFMAATGAAYLVVFGLCLIPRRRRSDAKD